MPTPPLLLDDFRAERSAIDTTWQLFTDRVMGGRSDAQAKRSRIAGTHCLVVEGLVRTEGNGGFLQVALPLAPADGVLDASAYTGVRVTVARGSGTWALHLRTPACTAPWMHYRAELPGRAVRQWVPVDVPFTAFSAEGVGTALDVRTLQRLGIVAVKPAGPAQLAISRVELV
ncbi:MAG: CIA30 family protein [Gemmatimonadaceae bacterium]|nr:CIA30 family protein [Gemmatimonadaceae bacterium]